MKPYEEIRTDKRLMFKKQSIEFQLYARTAMQGGIIILSNGHRGTFVMGRDEGGMEHVSVQLQRKLPTCEEMCEIKDIFWSEEEMVVQIHPRKSEYVNITDALHLWRPKDGDWGRLNGKEAEDADCN